MHELLHTLAFRVDRADADLAAELLATVTDAPSAVETHPDAAEAEVRVYLPSREELAGVRDRLGHALAGWNSLFRRPVRDLRALTIQREDWAESWKQFFHVRKVSRRLVVKPSWEDYAPAAGEIVLPIDPGMSFGTGQHATTIACLRCLDSFRDELGPVSFLDVGCGSGILSLAAVRLGFDPVEAFDNDPAAARIAGENLRAAGVESVTPRARDLAELPPSHAWMIVAANILSPVLMAHAECLIAALAPGPDARLILSGIVDTDYATVRERYQRLGLTEAGRATVETWTTGWYRWRSA